MSIAIGVWEQQSNSRAAMWTIANHQAWILLISL